MITESKKVVFGWDFKTWKGLNIYPGYNGTDDCLVAIIKDVTIYELYSAETDWDSNGQDIPTNLKRINIEDMSNNLLDYLHYRLVDHDYYILSPDTLKYLVNNKIVVKEWARWYKTRYYEQTNLYTVLKSILNKFTKKAG